MSDDAISSVRYILCSLFVNVVAAPGDVPGVQEDGEALGGEEVKGGEEGKAGEDELLQLLDVEAVEGTKEDYAGEDEAALNDPAVIGAKLDEEEADVGDDSPAEEVAEEVDVMVRPEDIEKVTEWYTEIGMPDFAAMHVLPCRREGEGQMHLVRM